MPPRSYRDLLRIPDLPALLAATTLSRLAGRMFSLAIVLYALERFSSPALAGWLSFAAVVPGLAVSPLAGALLDRIGPVSAIAVDMAASAALMLALTVADWLGWANPATLLVLVAIYSLTNPLSRAGVRTLLPRLVPPEALDRANALDTATYAAIDVIGPGLAGVLIGFGGSLPALIVIALTFGAAAMFTARIHYLSPRQRLVPARNGGRRLACRQPADAARPRAFLFALSGDVGRARRRGAGLRDPELRTRHRKLGHGSVVGRIGCRRRHRRPGRRPPAYDGP
jgi:MFS family permease